MFKRFIFALAAAMLIAQPQLASAQFSDSYNFLKAVRDTDGAKATEFLNRPGSVIVNTRDISTGETALHIVTARRDQLWLGFLLQRGADPNMRDQRGNTPLLLATDLRWAEGVEALLARRAQPDVANSTGETPLARAVMRNDVAVVRLLLAAGANPNRADNAGFTPKDLARRDPRLAGMLKELEAAKPVTAKPVQGPR